MLQHSQNCDTSLAGFAHTTRDGQKQDRQAPVAEPLLHRTPHHRGCNGRPNQDSAFLRMKIKKNKHFNHQTKNQQMHLKMILKNKTCPSISWH